MPKILMNDRAVAGLKPTPGQQVNYFDRGRPGFGVRVSPAGTKTFFVFYRVKGKLKNASLGTYPDTPLATARERATAATEKADDGVDVVDEAREKRKHTWDTVGAEYIVQHAKRRKRSWAEDDRNLRHQFPEWAGRPISSIRRQHVRALVEAIVDRGAPIRANRILALIRKILNFAVDREYVETNVAARMAPPSPESSRERVLTEPEIRRLWTYLEAPPDSELPATDQRRRTLLLASLKLRLITAQRDIEVVSLRWSDIDGAWWTIPAAIAKNKLGHRVPLSNMALALLEKLRPSAGEDYVFEGIRGKRWRRNALVGAGLTDVRPHDLRRTAATMMTSGGVPRFDVSKVLNHVEKGVTAVYDRSAYDGEKQRALNWWAAKLQAVIAGTSNKVLPFTRSA
jgi:integrase